MHNKRLFVVKDSDTKKMVGETFYSDKKAAKKARIQLNDEAGRDRYIVSPGPDHHKYKD